MTKALSFLFLFFIFVCFVFVLFFVITNIPGDGRKFLGHFIHHFGSQISESSAQSQRVIRIRSESITPKFATESEFYHIFVLRCAILSDIRSGSSF